MMAEWYRLGMTFIDLIDETLDFVRVFLETFLARSSAIAMPLSVMQGLIM